MSADHLDQISAVSFTPIKITVEFADGHTIRANRFWLRDNCPQNGDRASLFRTFTADEIPDDLMIVSATSDSSGLTVHFDDGTTDRFNGHWLRDNCGPVGESRSWEPWAAGFAPDVTDFASLGDGSEQHHALLETLTRSGCAIVTGAPTDAAGSEAMAALLGPVRETDFGRMFDIVSEPTPFTPSQSSSALDPHTDDPYRYTPSGISMLHCVAQSDGEGGDSIIVDGFAVADSLRRDDPAAFDLLSTVRVPFVHRRDQSVEQGADVHLFAEAPIIATDASGAPCGIRFHERSMDCLRIDADVADRFYPALAAFSRAARGGEFEIRRRLASGDVLVYDNQRVLHGRTAFDGAQSRRHLRLCTVDRDQVHSRLRRLRAVFAPGTEYGSLTAGNLA